MIEARAAQIFSRNIAPQHICHALDCDRFTMRFAASAPRPCQTIVALQHYPAEG
jgi:hypothetical protein